MKKKIKKRKKEVYTIKEIIWAFKKGYKMGWEESAERAIKIMKKNFPEYV